MTKIKDIKAREILDSRGNPTVEVDVILENNIIGRAEVPSGASTGEREALELRDNDPKRYLGKGVMTAVNNVNNILKNHIIGMDVSDQEEIDKTLINLDGTENKNKYGANAILGISMACLKASALDKNIPLYKYFNKEGHLPNPMMNILNGGMHADNNIDFQEFMIIPNAETFKKKIQIASEVFHTLKKVLKEKGYQTGVGDEGGFAPNFKKDSSIFNSGNIEDVNPNEKALDMLMMAVKEAGYVPGKDVNFALDVAASEFYENGIYNLEGAGKKFNTDQFIDYYQTLLDKYPIVSIEDPVDENDWEGFKKMTERYGDKIQLVGDDLFVTNKKYLQKGIDMKAGNAILLKVNQIGTITETLETIKLAKENNYKTIISHRSGETEDVIIADLAVALDLGQIKTGSLSRTDRVAKYNELLRIEENINE